MRRWLPPAIWQKVTGETHLAPANSICYETNITRAQFNRCNITTQKINMITAVHISKYLLVVFFEGLTSPGQVWAAPSRFCIVSETKVSRFSIVPERPESIAKHSGPEVCKAGAAREGDWHHTESANQMHCLQMTQFDCFAPNYGIM